MQKLREPPPLGPSACHIIGHCRHAAEAQSPHQPRWGLERGSKPAVEHEPQPQSSRGAEDEEACALLAMSEPCHRQETGDALTLQPPLTPQLQFLLLGQNRLRLGT